MDVGRDAAHAAHNALIGSKIVVERSATPKRLPACFHVTPDRLLRSFGFWDGLGPATAGLAYKPGCNFKRSKCASMRVTSA